MASGTRTRSPRRVVRDASHSLRTDCVSYLLMVAFESRARADLVWRVGRFQPSDVRRQLCEFLCGAPPNRLEIVPAVRGPASTTHPRSQQRTARKLFPGPRDDIANGFAVFLLSEDLLASGQNRFVTRQLRAPLASVFRQFVRNVQRRRIVRDTYARAHTEAVDRRACIEELRDLPFVEATAGEDANVLETGGIEHGPGLTCQRAEIS